MTARLYASEQSRLAHHGLAYIRTLDVQASTQNRWSDASQDTGKYLVRLAVFVGRMTRASVKVGTSSLLKNPW